MRYKYEYGFFDCLADLVHTLPNHRVAAVHTLRTNHLHVVALDVHTVDQVVAGRVHVHVLETVLDTVVDNEIIIIKMNVFLLYY